MRASELILKLQKMIKLHGDCDVWYSNSEWDTNIDCGDR